MENKPTYQPVIIKERKSISLAEGVFITALVGAGGYFGYKAWNRHRANKVAEKLDTPEAQAASNIYNASHWYNDDEEVAYAAARDIAAKKLDWKKVADVFLKLYGKNIDDYLSFLGPEEKQKFFNILNLTTPAKQGTPPPAAKTQFDTTKNIVLAFATGQGHIRKSPKIMGTSILLRPVKSDNIVWEAKNVKTGVYLGTLTGKTQMYYADNSTTGTLFYEFQVPLLGGTGQYKLWIAAQFVRVDQYKTLEVAKLALKKETDAKNYLTIPKAAYDAASN